MCPPPCTLQLAGGGAVRAQQPIGSHLGGLSTVWGYKAEEGGSRGQSLTGSRGRRRGGEGRGEEREEEVVVVLVNCTEIQ